LADTTIDAPLIDAGVWIDAGERLQPQTIALRRAIHAEPEIGLDCPATVAKIKAALAGLPLELREGPSSGGLMAILPGPSNGRTVLLRGDMDALPLTEDTGLDFRSQTNGAMHACGHDTHVAMLAGAAKALCAERERLAGTVMFMFQPGEEGYKGAKFMLEDGLLDAPSPDAAFALHITPNLPSGVFASKEGALLASDDTLILKVTGAGGHAAMPHEACDPVPIACEIVLALQSFITRKISVFAPAVLSITRIDAGQTSNVIPETVTLIGTLRTHNEHTRGLAIEGIRRVVEHVAAAHGARGESDIREGYPVTSNNGRIVDLAEAAATTLFGESGWRRMPTPMMGAEDFSYVLNRFPGAMAFLGASPEGGDWRTCCSLHSNRMVLDEAVMARGVAMHCAMAQAMLTGEI
jgi:hippurate hydrolase